MSHKPLSQQEIEYLFNVIEDASLRLASSIVQNDVGLAACLFACIGTHKLGIAQQLGGHIRPFIQKAIEVQEMSRNYENN